MSFLKEYTLLGELGSGGFAKVYKVRHNKLGYIRAIRVLNEPVTDEDSPTYQKFLRECKVLLRLGNGCHHNIVHIYQPRLLDNHAVVEMDYVDGKDISHYLDENGNFLPVDEVLRMTEEISSALAYCHEDIYKFCMDPDEDNLESDPIDGGKFLIDDATRKRLVEKYKVIHNDIHSGNIMRRGDGTFVLLDFGLAITDGDDVRKSSRHENGAVEFKAPEKWEDDRSLTEQSDIYSFGVVMYEYLAGRVPFPYDKSLSSTEATYKLSKQHKEQRPSGIFDLRKAYYEAKYPGKTYEKDYPDWLEAVIMKCLEKDPINRFKNGKELNECIVGHLNEPITPNEPTVPIKPAVPNEPIAPPPPILKPTFHCKRCGAELASDSKFCEQCRKKTGRLISIIAFAVLFVGGGLWFLLGRVDKESQPALSYTVSAVSANKTMGTVTGGGTFYAIVTTTIEAVPNKGYKFVSWNDGNTERIRKVVTDHNQEYTARFEVATNEPAVPKFWISVQASDETMGTVKGSGYYDSQSVITIEAVAKEGFKFSGWDDGDKKNPRSIKVESNHKYVAEFVEKPKTKPSSDPKPTTIDWNGVATYKGDMQSGLPHGYGGKLVFYSNYQLDLKNVNGTKLEILAGETIEDAKFVNGKLRQGTLHRKDGTTKWFSI